MAWIYWAPCTRGAHRQRRAMPGGFLRGRAARSPGMARRYPYRADNAHKAAHFDCHLTTYPHSRAAFRIVTRGRYAVPHAAKEIRPPADGPDPGHHFRGPCARHHRQGGHQGIGQGRRRRDHREHPGIADAVRHHRQGTGRVAAGIPAVAGRAADPRGAGTVRLLQPGHHRGSAPPGRARAGAYPGGEGRAGARAPRAHRHHRPGHVRPVPAG